MPNRIIKESACTSDTLASISSDAERLWWRLVVQADDYGCFDGRPNVILGKCLTAFIGRFRDSDVIHWLDEMERAGLIQRYNADGKPYIHLTKWSEHQRPARAKEPKYPLPTSPDATCQYVTANDSNREHMTANAVTQRADNSELSRQTSEQVTAYDSRREHVTADAPVVGNRSRESGGGSGRAREGAHTTAATATEMIGDDSVTPHRFYERVVGELVTPTVDMLFQEFEDALAPSALKWGIWEAGLSDGRGTKYLRRIYERLKREGLTTAEAAEAHERNRRSHSNARASPPETTSAGLAAALRSAQRRLREAGEEDTA